MGILIKFFSCLHEAFLDFVSKTLLLEAFFLWLALMQLWIVNNEMTRFLGHPSYPCNLIFWTYCLYQETSSFWSGTEIFWSRIPSHYKKNINLGRNFPSHNSVKISVPIKIWDKIWDIFLSTQSVGDEIIFSITYLGQNVIIYF